MISLNFFFVKNYFPDTLIFLSILITISKIFIQKILKSFFTDIFPFFTEFNGFSA